MGETNGLLGIYIQSVYPEHRQVPGLLRDSISKNKQTTKQDGEV